MRDLRRFTRWQIDKPAKIRLEGRETFINCSIKDISLKGMRIGLGAKLPRDAFLDLSLILSDEFILDKIEAWVVWQRSVSGLNFYGLYFSKISDGNKEKIYQFVRHYVPSQLTQQWWRKWDLEKGGEIMQEEKPEDRRVFDRFPVDLPLRFLYANQEGQVRTKDVSAKGIGLVADRELAPQTPLEMWLEIPDKGEPLYIRGEVVWSKPMRPNEYLIGVNLERADLMGLARVLRTKRQQQMAG